MLKRQAALVSESLLVTLVVTCYQKYL